MGALPDIPENTLRVIVLRRAEGGRLFTSGGMFFDGGQPLPVYLAPVVPGLVDDGDLRVLADSGSSRRLLLSDTGGELLGELDAWRTNQWHRP